MGKGWCIGNSDRRALQRCTVGPGHDKLRQGLEGVRDPERRTSTEEDLAAVDVYLVSVVSVKAERLGGSTDKDGDAVNRPGRWRTLGEKRQVAC